MNKKNIKVPYPVNIKEQDLHFFENRSTYSVSEIQVRKFKNVFVSHEGLCLKNLKLIPNSTFNMCGKEDNTFYFQYYRLVLEQWAVSKFGKSLPSITLKDRPYFIIHTKWFNYSFWINSALVRLLKVEEKGYLEQALLIYPESWSNNTYINESIKAFPKLKTKVIPDGHHLFIRKLVLPEVRSWTASVNPNNLQMVRARMYQYLDGLSFDFNFGDKVYLSREKRGLRLLENEKEVQTFLKKRGFAILCFEDFSFWEQVYIMKSAKYFISIHGAGMANINFMESGGKVLEFVNRKYAELEYTFPFWRQGSGLGLRHYVQFGNPIGSYNTELVKFGAEQSHSTNKNYLVNQNIHINLDELAANLKVMKGNKPNTKTK